MSHGLWWKPFREGSCPDFGRVRPIHLSDVATIERRQDVRNGEVTSTARMQWAKPQVAPRAGEYLSIHQRYGKVLVVVDRVSRSCICCPSALLFLHTSDVEGVLPQRRVCECVGKRVWQDSSAWFEAPESGVCKRVGSDSIRKISDAIKAKGRQQ